MWINYVTPEMKKRIHNFEIPITLHLKKIQNSSIIQEDMARGLSRRTMQM